jgi:hypothetical protein
MNSILESPLTSEILSQEEVQDISGCCRKGDQIKWFNAKGWTFITNRAGEPVVGRLYARLKLTGINPAMLSAPAAWTPDFSKVR